MISFLVYSIRFNESDKGPFLSGFSFMLAGVDVDPDCHLTLAALATAFAFCSAVSRSNVSGLIRRPECRPSKVLAGPTICEAHLEASAFGHCLMFNYADAGGFHLPPGILAALARFGTALSRTVQYNIAAQLKATTIQATIPVHQN